MKITEIKLNKEIPYDKCVVSTVINNVITQLHSIIYEKRALINTNITSEIVDYPGAYFENIMYNLISNALKYSKPDVPPQVTISVDAEGCKNIIKVKDNGLGINMAKYGDRLFKMNQVFHSGFDSRGIGLYITKTQVESLGGTIDVISAENAGSEFIVTL